VSTEEMQLELHRLMAQGLKDLTDEKYSTSMKPPLKGKEIVREAQRVKWQAKRLARMALAIEVLESINPHYNHQ